MKKIISSSKHSLFAIMLVICLGFTLWSFSTSDKTITRVSNEKMYCQLSVNNVFNRLQQSWTFEISINYGAFLKYDYKSLEEYKVKSFTDYLDALNYLGSRGWKLVLTNRHMVDGYNHYQDYYLFEKDAN